jgi:hypothetical protein
VAQLQQELWGDLEELGGAERFLEACGLSGEALASALADAGEALTAFGTAMLRVTYGDDGVEVAVTPRAGTPAPSLPPDPPAISAGAL